MYKVKFPNAELTGLRLNGNNYISDTQIDASVFEDLSVVEITDLDAGVTETFTNMKLIHNTQYGDEFWFALEEKSAKEIAMENINKSLASTSTDITDIQMAMAEIYEMMLGGM